MKRLNKSRYYSFVTILPLVFAGLIYVLFRSTSTNINYLLQLCNCSVNYSKNISLPYWFVYCLPGALWLFSFQLIGIFSQSNQSLLNSIFRITLMLSIGVAIEFAQYFKITDGVFDQLDLLSYSISSLLAFLIAFLASKKQSLPTINIRFHWVFICFVLIVYLSDIHTSAF